MTNIGLVLINNASSGINLIIPSLVISIMTVLGFTLPPDACEKVTLGNFYFFLLHILGEIRCTFHRSIYLIYLFWETTILLSVIFFLQMVSDMSPPQSKAVPILGILYPLLSINNLYLSLSAAFFSCCLLVVSCSCVYTVMVLSMHHRKSETHEMGPLVSMKREEYGSSYVE